MSTHPKPIIIIDGSGYIFRAFYALPPMSRADGVPINAVYGFCNMLYRTMSDHTSDSIVVVFDAARKNFRNDIYPEYKAHRPPPPPELLPQFAIIHEACTAFGVSQLRIEGFEADDLIATLAHKAQKNNLPVRIITSDKDMMQLMSTNVEIFDPIKNKALSEEDVMQKFGVGPHKVIEVQALCGDTSDNIPGVRGIGPKTAAELIHQYGSLAQLYEHLDQIPQTKRRESLETHKENAFISYKLVQLRTDVPLDFNLQNFAYNYNPDVLKSFLHKQSFHSLLKRIEAESQNSLISTTQPTTIEKSDPEYTTITDMKTLETWVHEIIDSGIVAIDTETTSLNARQAQLVGISLCINPKKAAYIPLAHVKETSQESFLDLKSHPIDQLSYSQVLPLIQKITNNPSIIKIGHNIKYDLLILRQHNVEFQNIHDTMLMSYVLHGSKHLHNMDDLAKIYLDYETITYNQVMKEHKAKIFSAVPIKEATLYAAEDADITRRLYDVFRAEILTEKLSQLYETIERPLISALAEMEWYGAMVDPFVLIKLSNEFTKEMSVLEKEIFGLTKKEFNLASPKQLGDILFESLNLPGGTKTKTGAYGTGVDVLEGLVEKGFDIAQFILDWRQLSKLKSTYTDALVQQIHPQTKRVHTSYGMTITSTGRLSSSDPNLQNIPIRTPMGREIRKAFVADHKNLLISLDYSQIELRLLAHMANIKSLQNAFLQNQDIHALTASEVFGIPFQDVTKDMRSKAKAINFGIIYGISPFGLSKQLRISQSEAKRYIDAYFTKYPGIRNFMDNMITQARSQGYVETLMGRRCYTPEIHSKNPNIRGFSERQAINAPLQGSNADIIKKAMIHIDQELQKNHYESHMILQVHDELVIEAPQGKAQEIAEFSQKTMQNIVHLSIPLVVDFHIGTNWGDIH